MMANPISGLKSYSQVLHHAREKEHRECSSGVGILTLAWLLSSDSLSSSQIA